jgi:RNA polymerase primary sigma factor
MTTITTSRLGERAKMVLTMRYLHDMTLEQVGHAMGITRERVRQIENRAMVAIRNRSDLRERARGALGCEV